MCNSVQPVATCSFVAGKTEEVLRLGMGVLMEMLVLFEPLFPAAFVLPAGKKEEVLRLGMGVLMEMMVQRMQAAAQGANKDVKMYLYS